LGLHASKWSRQKGQKSTVDDVTEARRKQDWPLDSVRVHARNCGQGIWASQQLNWPDDGWGGFGAVDKLIQRLHGMNCHVIFWESPGIPPACTEKYDTAYEGGRTITYEADLTKVPILVKAGAIIPMAPSGQRYVDELKTPLTDLSFA